MDKKLQAFLDGAFAPYGDFPSRADVTRELLTNLQDKYADLRAQGLGDDEAYRATIDSFGDVSEIMEQLPHAPKSPMHTAAQPTPAAIIDDQPGGGIHRSLKDALRQAKKSLSRFAATDLHATDLADSVLPETDFSMSDLQGAGFDRSDLSRAIFRATALRGASFRGADLTSATIWASDTSDADFSGANLTGAKLRASALHGATFTGATLRATEFVECDLSDLSFDGQTLEETKFVRSSLKRTSFQGTTLRNVTFHHSDPKGAIFTGATMDKITFALLKNTKANLTGVIIADKPYYDKLDV